MICLPPAAGQDAVVVRLTTSLAKAAAGLDGAPLAALLAAATTLASEATAEVAADGQPLLALALERTRAATVAVRRLVALDVG